MIHNLSVSAKGAVAFIGLAFIATLSGLIGYQSVTQGREAVYDMDQANALVGKVELLRGDMLDQVLAARSFILTGERGMLEKAQAATSPISQNIERLTETARQFDGPYAAHVGAIAVAWQSWLNDHTQAQFELMRDPLTVDLARAMESSGQGDAALGQLFKAFDALGADAQARNARMLEIKTAALDRAVLASLAGGGLLAGLALLFGLLNHGMISAPLKKLAGVTEGLAAGDTTQTVSFGARGDEIGALASALDSFRENMKRTQALEAESALSRDQADAARKATLSDLAQRFEETVLVTTEAMIEEFEALTGSADELSQIANSTAERSESVSSASEHATSNVNVVASATEELTASIAELNQQVHGVSAAARDAADGVDRSNQSVEQLQTVVERIGDVTKLINDIAEQTNLLALNATIEAARAGEAGKGFAVVASEVKALAAQTGKATEEIDTQISQMKQAADESISASASVADMVKDIAERTSAMAAATEEQNTATDEIARNVTEAADGTATVTHSMNDMREAAGNTGQMSAAMTQAIQQMDERSRSMRDSMREFLERVRAAA
jgi:methyl-accepting chemotaxis protein